jgi:hypothetical protein
VADYLLAPTGAANGHDYYFRSKQDYTDEHGYECLFTTLGGTMHLDYNAKLTEMLLIDAAILVFGVQFIVNFRNAAGSILEFPKRLKCYFFYLTVSFANRVPKEVTQVAKNRLT